MQSFAVKIIPKGRRPAPGGGPQDTSKAARDSAGLPPARDIWISSGLRSLASGLREFPGFGGLELFGIPWILSSEMSLFNGLHATRGQKKFARPLSGHRPRKWPPSIRTSTADEKHRRRKELEVVAVNVARIRSGIGITLRPPSPFCKKMLITYYFMQNRTRPASRKTQHIISRNRGKDRLRPLRGRRWRDPGR